MSDPIQPRFRVKAVAPIFTETELMKEISHRMKGLFEITEWNKLGFHIDGKLIFIFLITFLSKLNIYIFKISYL